MMDYEEIEEPHDHKLTDRHSIRRYKRRAIQTFYPPDHDG
jgi:hypothetical protein